MYRIHPVMDRAEVMILKHLYWTGLMQLIKIYSSFATLVNVQKGQIKNMVNYQVRNLKNTME